MIAIIVKLRIRAGLEDEFERIFAERRGKVLANERDALQYDLYRSPGEQGSFLIIERFPSADAYRAHLAGSRDFERMMACFAQPPQVSMFDSVQGAS